MNTDTQTTVAYLKTILKEFRDERDWKQFHDPKNLAEAISIEAAELLELFLWKNPTEIKKLIKSDRSFKKKLEDELADVLCFSFSLANVTGIDVARAITAKIDSNRRKYPVEKAKGRSTKYDRL